MEATTDIPAVLVQRQTGRGTLWMIAALMALTVGVYAVSLKSELVYDATFQILDDDYIHTPRHLLDVLTFRVMSQDVLDFNRPVHLLVLMIDSLIWGRNPIGYHLTSILFHTASTVLLFLIMDRWLAEESDGDSPAGQVKMRRIGAALGAALFAVHPVVAEAVAEPSYREDVLAGFFLLMALWLAGRWCGRTLGSAVGILACVLGAVGSKEIGVAVVPVLAAYWWLRRRDRPRGPWLALLAGAAVIAVAFVCARFALEPTTSKVFAGKPSYLGGSFASAIQIQPRIFAMYVRHIGWPAGLCADYNNNSIKDISAPAAWITLGGILLAQAVAARFSRLMLMSAVVFWATLLPASNLLPMFRPAADRYCYAPMIGVAMTVAALLAASISGGVIQVARLGIAGLAVVLLAVLSVERQTVFASSLNLWTDTITTNPSSVTAAGNLGWAKLEDHDLAGALDAFGRTINMSQGKNADAFAGAAIALDELGRRPDAERVYQRAIELNPMYADPERSRKTILLTLSQAEALGAIVRHQPAPSHGSR